MKLRDKLFHQPMQAGEERETARWQSAAALQVRALSREMRKQARAAAPRWWKTSEHKHRTCQVPCRARRRVSGSITGAGLGGV